MAIFLIYLVPLVLPSLVYALWRLWRAQASPGGRPAASGEDASTTAPDAAAPGEAIDWRAAPWPWLILAGGALLALVLLLGVLTEGAPQQGRYLPPRLENGRITPGELQPGAGGAAQRPNQESAPP